MNRLFASAAVALLLGLTPALAADESGKLPTQPGVSSEAAKAATVPPTGTPDTSGGAAEQSSAPPNSAAGNAYSAEKNGPANDADPSSGAKEQSSAPPGSSAASTSKPNPTSGTQPETEQN